MEKVSHDPLKVTKVSPAAPDFAYAGTMRCLALGLALAAACGSVKKTNDAPTPDAPDPNDGARSGTRLKLKWQVYADGTRDLVENLYRDGQLGTDCHLDNFSDGHPYCVPVGMGLGYANNTCTQKIGLAFTPATCARPAQDYIVQYSSTMPCTSPVTHVYQRGAQVAGTQYWLAGPTVGSCTGPYSNSYTFFAIGNEVLPTQLVQLTTGSIGQGAFTVSTNQSADGFVVPLHLHDNTNNQDCNPFSLPGTTSAKCVPTDTISAGYYNDAQCMQPEVASLAACTPPPVAVQFPPNRCTIDPPNYFSLGQMVSAPPLYNLGATCASTPPPTGYNFFTVGSPITLGQLSRSPQAVADHRIQVIQLMSGVTRFRDRYLTDMMLDDECRSFTAYDGSVVCLPGIGASFGTYYTDVGCTVTMDIAIMSRGPNTCESTAPKHAVKFTGPQAGQCASTFEVRQVGAAYTGQLYTKGTTCNVIDTTHVAMYQLGATVPIASLATAITTTDP
jgi:hypothetical protein